MEGADPAANGGGPEQGGLLSQEDLALPPHSDTRTIRRDIRELREEKGIYVATRGQIQDIGPGVSHKGVAIGHWLAGLGAVEVARRINHTLHATERYIHTFCRVVFLARKGLQPLQIALTVGISSGGTRTFLDIYEAHRKKPDYARRFEEIDLIGAQHHEAEDLDHLPQANRAESAEPIAGLKARGRSPSQLGGPSRGPETSCTSRRPP